MKLKCKYIAISVVFPFMVSTASYAAAGPSVSKTLTVNVKATAALTANWVAPANIYAEQLVNSTPLIATLTLVPTSIQTVTIASTDAGDATQQGTVTFKNTTDSKKTFKTLMSTNTSGVVLTKGQGNKGQGNAVVKSATAGNDLPGTVSVQFNAIKNASSTATVGAYTATINLTSVIA